MFTFIDVESSIGCRSEVVDSKMESHLAQLIDARGASILFIMKSNYNFGTKSNALNTFESRRQTDFRLRILHGRNLHLSNS